MNTLLLTALASLAAVAVAGSVAAPAHAKTRFDTYRVQMPPLGTPLTPKDGGVTEFEVKMQNSRKNRKRFNPRQVIRMDFESVPLSCATGGAPAPFTELLLTRSLQPAIPVKAAPPPVAKEPKPGRYAYRFSHSFGDFAGTITATIDKPNERKQGTPARLHGSFTITGLDSDATHFNCATMGQRGFSVKRPVG